VWCKEVYLKHKKVVCFFKKVISEHLYAIFDKWISEH